MFSNSDMLGVTSVNPGKTDCSVSDHVLPLRFALFSFSPYLSIPPRLLSLFFSFPLCPPFQGEHSNRSLLYILIIGRKMETVFPHLNLPGPKKN